MRLLVTGGAGGTAQQLVLSATDVPPGLHARFGATSIVAGGSTTLTVSADANAALHTDALLVVRATGAQTHSASILIQVIAPPSDWSLSIAPPTGTTGSGRSGFA